MLAALSLPRKGARREGGGTRMRKEGVLLWTRESCWVERDEEAEEEGETKRTEWKTE